MALIDRITGSNPFSLDVFQEYDRKKKNEYMGGLDEENYEAYAPSPKYQELIKKCKLVNATLKELKASILFSKKVLVEAEEFKAQWLSHIIIRPHRKVEALRLNKSIQERLNKSDNSVSAYEQYLKDKSIEDAIQVLKDIRDANVEFEQSIENEEKRAKKIYKDVKKERITALKAHEMLKQAFDQSDTTPEIYIKTLVKAAKSESVNLQKLSISRSSVKQPVVEDKNTASEMGVKTVRIAKRQAATISAAAKRALEILQTYQLGQEALDQAILQIKSFDCHVEFLQELNKIAQENMQPLKKDFLIAQKIEDSLRKNIRWWKDKSADLIKKIKSDSNSLKGFCKTIL